MKKRYRSCGRKWNCRDGARASKLLPMRQQGLLVTLVVITVSVTSVACDRLDQAGSFGAGAAPPGPFAEMSSPVGENSRTPRLASRAGRMILSWQTAGAGDTAHVRFAMLRGRRWTPARTVVSSTALFVNWADYPSVVPLAGDSLAAHWLQYNGPGTYAYQVRLAVSADAGATWSPPVIPHETKTETEHGFVTLLPRPGGLEVFWLDGRAYEGGAQQMSLRNAWVGTNGGRGREVVLDQRTCDCCQTGVAALGDTLIVVYRGRSDDEIRDIEVVRRVDGEWTSPVRVHRDGWRIDACPVNGPAIAAAEGRVLVAWFTAAGGEARVFGVVSTDGGASFGPPFTLDEGRPIGRVAAIPLADGRMAVGWVEALEAVDGGAEVRVRLVDRDGVMSPSTSVVQGAASRASGFPGLAELDGDLIVAWTDADANVVRLARGAIP